MGTDELRRVAVGADTIEFAERGEGEPLLLVHGGVFADWFGPVAEDPALADFRAIRVRRAGYLADTLPSGSLTIADHGRHCAQLLDALGIERAHVVGHSSGALATIELAIQRPDLVASLAVIEPARVGNTWPAAPDDRMPLGALFRDAAAAGDVAAAFRSFMGVVCAADYLDVMRSMLGAKGVSQAEMESKYFFADEVPAVLDWAFDAADAARVLAPVLVIQGGNSPPFVRDAMAQLAHWLPDASVETIVGSDHMLPLRHPAELAGVIASFAAATGGT